MKMKYEKPTSVDLSTRARAAGSGPLGCYNGGAATGTDEACSTGTGATYSLLPCWPGTSPTDGGFDSDCITGTGAFYCESGSGADPGSDPDGCRVGPSVTP